MSFDSCTVQSGLDYVHNGPHRLNSTAPDPSQITRNSFAPPGGIHDFGLSFSVGSETTLHPVELGTLQSAHLTDDLPHCDGNGGDFIESETRE